MRGKKTEKLTWGGGGGRDWNHPVSLTRQNGGGGGGGTGTIQRH